MTPGSSSSSFSFSSSSHVRKDKGPVCVYMKEHPRRLSESLHLLRMQDGLVDLDIECEGERVRAHKAVMAAASRFFGEKLLKANVMIPVMLRLEDFGLSLSRRAVSNVVDFVYRGEVVVPGDRMGDVCAPAHALGTG